MAEIFGAVAAGIGVGSELIRLGRAIQKRIKRIRDSQKDIEKLASETIIFAGLYKKFLCACEDDRDAYTTDVSAIRPLTSWAQKTADSLAALLQKVEALYPRSKPRTGFEDRAVAHLVWYRSTSTVKALRASLSVARESINGFSNLMCLEKLKDQLKILKEALLDPRKRSELERRLGVSVEARILEIDQDIADTEVVYHESMEMRDQAEQKVTRYRERSQTMDEVPAPQELAKFTEVLDGYAKHLLPSKQRKHRSSSGSSASTTEPTFNTVFELSQPSPFASSISSNTQSKRREERIGRHIIRLNDADITVNGQPLSFNSFELGQQFFESLLKHHHKLDQLDEALSKGLDNWKGIPGWVVRPNVNAKNNEG